MKLNRAVQSLLRTLTGVRKQAKSQGAYAKNQNAQLEQSQLFLEHRENPFYLPNPRNFLNRDRYPDAPAPTKEQRSPFVGAREHQFIENDGDTELNDYLYWGKWLDCVSSNVWQIHYLIDEQRLEVQFLNHGSTYEYLGVAVELAYDFAVAVSKGEWVWDHLRSAGVAYKFLSSTDGHIPERTNPKSRKSQKRLDRTIADLAGVTARPGKRHGRMTLSEIHKHLKGGTRPTKRVKTGFIGRVLNRLKGGK